jgi:hypothetical protein
MILCAGEVTAGISFSTDEFAKACLQTRPANGGSVCKPGGINLRGTEIMLKVGLNRGDASDFGVIWLDRDGAEFPAWQQFAEVLAASP